MAILIAVSAMRRKSTASTAGPFSRVLIVAPCFVILCLGGFYMFRSMIERHVYWRVALSGVFVVVLLLWVFWPDRSKLK
jgi:CDP-diglyceride synthetase